MDQGFAFLLQILFTAEIGIVSNVIVQIFKLQFIQIIFTLVFSVFFIILIVSFTCFSQTFVFINVDNVLTKWKQIFFYS